MNSSATAISQLHLTTKEKQDPESVFTSFFESFDLDDAVLELRKAKKALVKREFPFSINKMEKENIDFFFEKIEKLIVAAYLMRG